jgi:preprotein translocase subunit SecG
MGLFPETLVALVLFALVAAIVVVMAVLVRRGKDK